MRSHYIDSLLAERSGDQIPVWSSFFVPCPVRSRGPLTLVYDVCLVFYQGKDAGAWC